MRDEETEVNHPVEIAVAHWVVVCDYDSADCEDERLLSERADKDFPKLKKNETNASVHIVSHPLKFTHSHTNPLYKPRLYLSCTKLC